MKQCVIMCGLQGSGKSHLTAQICETSNVFHNVCSTDDFWTIGGPYDFQPKLLGAAHKWNQGRVIAAMRCNVQLIVVDNTNMTAWERAPYLEFAQLFGYEVQYMVPETPWAWNPDECHKKQMHGVPLEGIWRRLGQWEPPFDGLGPTHEAAQEMYQQYLLKQRSQQ